VLLNVTDFQNKNLRPKTALFFISNSKFYHCLGIFFEIFHVREMGWQRDVVLGAYFQHFQAVCTSNFDGTITIRKLSFCMLARKGLQARIVFFDRDEFSFWGCHAWFDVEVLCSSLP
jgi:hypothetical protein